MSWKHLGHYGVNNMFATRFDYWVNEEEGTFASGGGYASVTDELPDNAVIESLPEGGVNALVAAKSIELD